MKTKEELNKPLAQIDEEKLFQVTGGLTQEEIEKLKEQAKARTLDEHLNLMKEYS